MNEVKGDSTKCTCDDIKGSILCAFLRMLSLICMESDKIVICVNSYIITKKRAVETMSIAQQKAEISVS